MCAKSRQNAPRNNIRILKHVTGGLWKTMPKTSIKINATKKQNNLIWSQTWHGIIPTTGLNKSGSWGFVWYLLPRWRQEASRRPLDRPNQKITEQIVCVSLVCMHFCISFSIRGLARRVHGESHCNYFRLELYLPSLHTVPANCWGSGRWLGKMLTELFGGAKTRRKSLR